MPNKLRIVIAVLVAIALTTIMTWIKTDLEAWSNTVIVADEPEVRQAIVRSGDTLWAIASREYPGEHTGKMVHEILAVNPEIGRDCVIRPGQRVRLP